MGGRFPPLDRSRVELILKSAKFKPVRTKGSHTHWEGYVEGIRRIVTVDHLNSKKEKYGPLPVGENDRTVRTFKEEILLSP